MNMKPEARLQELGISLPELPKPLGSYVPFVQAGSLIFVSGMLPFVNGKINSCGRVGEKVTLVEAEHAARTAAINGLAVLKSAVGSLDHVKRCVKITGYVASARDFTDQPKVVNGASDLLFAVFGDAGLHARAAVGVDVLPMDSPVEIEFIFEVF